MIRVLHITQVEIDNPFLDDLVDGSAHDQVTHSAVTLSADRGFVGGLESRGVRAWALDCNTRERYPRAFRELWTLVREQRPDIIHTHIFDPTMMGMALGRMLGTRRVITRHYSDQVHRLPHPLKRWGYRALQSWGNRSAHHIIAPSRRVFEVLTQVEGVPAAKVTVIPYPQTMGRYQAVTPDAIARVRAELGFDGAYAVVNVGRLHVDKGHRYLFDAFRQFVAVEPRAKLWLVGIGPSEAELKQRVSELGLSERTRFLGFRNDVLPMLAAADVVVHATLSEALPIVVIESLSLERPLVCTLVSGVPELVGESEHGLVVPPADAQALFKAMCEVRANPDAALARAARGRCHVMEYLDHRRVAAAYLDCYRKVLARG
jgi:glycosyltransferase involved in cell wall biosynthesis